MPDSAHGTREISPATDAPPATVGLAALDRLVATHGIAHLLSERPLPAAAGALRSAVRVLCDEARRTSPSQAERLVIVLRAAWPMLPAVRDLPPGDGGARLLARVLSLAIAEFYQPTANGAP